MTEQDVELRDCPSCGTRSRIITRGDARGTVVSACCEAELPESPGTEDVPVVLVERGRLVCPYPDCGAPDQLIELDVATRANQLSLGENGQIVAYTGDSQWESDGYQCGRCSRPVSLPNGATVTHI
ncbi:hypothetical protein ACFMQL_20140 [Nonomuraea fastidiosa]|uniref:hypothetical protein n=1 Tax=Nonomuraea fastidiosa TaxID=46173 RepID=UPI00366B7F17